MGSNVHARPLDGPITDYFFTILPEEQAHSKSGRASADALDPKSIKAIVWNIKKTQEPAWQDEFVNFSEGKDLLLIQEAYQNDLFNSTSLGMDGYRWDMGASFLYRRYNNTATGTMIGSKARPTEILVKHSVDEEPVTGTPKSMTFAKYPIAGTGAELLAISVHGINLTSHGSFVRQMLQAKAEIEDHDGPVLFAGDFNTRTKRRTRYLMNLVKKLKLNEIKFKHADYRMVWKFTRNYLDHGFVRGLDVKSAEVLKDSRGSDHMPMVMEMSFPDTSSL